jgi:hypothetical protein
MKFFKFVDELFFRSKEYLKKLLLKWEKSRYYSFEEAAKVLDDHTGAWDVMKVTVKSMCSRKEFIMQKFMGAVHSSPSVLEVTSENKKNRIVKKGRLAAYIKLMIKLSKEADKLTAEIEKPKYDKDRKELIDLFVSKGGTCDFKRSFVIKSFGRGMDSPFAHPEDSYEAVGASTRTILEIEAKEHKSDFEKMKLRLNEIGEIENYVFKREMKK